MRTVHPGIFWRTHASLKSITRLSTPAARPAVSLKIRYVTFPIATEAVVRYGCRRSRVGAHGVVIGRAIVCGVPAVVGGGVLLVATSILSIGPRAHGCRVV